jgi:hypothetical protein
MIRALVKRSPTIFDNLLMQRFGHHRVWDERCCGGLSAQTTDARRACASNSPGKNRGTAQGGYQTVSSLSGRMG